MLLDASSSMGGKREQTISARNEVILEQKNAKLVGEETPPKFSYYTFSTILSLSIGFDSIKDVDVDILHYEPGGCTALLDAIGDILKKHEHERDVILFINTDGEENTSRKYSTETIKKNLINYQTNNGWIVHYLGANVDSWSISNSLGIREYNQSTETIPLHAGNTRATSDNLTSYRNLHISRSQSAPSSINECVDIEDIKIEARDNTPEAHDNTPEAHDNTPEAHDNTPEEIQNHSLFIDDGRYFQSSEFATPLPLMIPTLNIGPSDVSVLNEDGTFMPLLSITRSSTMSSSYEQTEPN